MILVRSTRSDAIIEAFARSLGEVSGETVALLLDERVSSASAVSLPRVALTEKSLGSLNLFVPADVGWRCGDYGLYLARATYPVETHFWLFDYDVRLTGDARVFFDACAARPEVDLLAAHIRPATPDWWWWASVNSSNAAQRRCFFPVVRLSARAIDALLLKRRAQARQPIRRMFWPNDEAFVATATEACGMHAADLNTLGDFYDPRTFSYLNVLDGNRFSCDEPGPRLHHPVLFGVDLDRKLARMARDERRSPSLLRRGSHKLAGLLNGRTNW